MQLENCSRSSSRPAFPLPSVMKYCFCTTADDQQTQTPGQMFTTDSGPVSDVSLEVKVKLISAEGRVQLNLEKGVEIDHVIRVIFGTGVVVVFVHDPQ